MDEIQIFKNDLFGNVRTIENGDKILFCGSDCAKALGYQNPSRDVNRHCKNIEKRCTTDSVGRQQETLFIPENDIYRLVTHSRLPEAQKFEKWIFEEVIPSIRKNGGYIAGQETLSDDELLAKALLVAQHKIDERDKKIAHQQTEIKRMKPKEIFADAVGVSKNTILIGDLAKLLKQNGIEIGQNRLFEWLREHCYLIRRKGKSFNLPTQRSMNLGLFKIKENVITDKNGNNFTYSTTTVTPKGQQYFIDKFLNL